MSEVIYVLLNCIIQASILLCHDHKLDRDPEILFTRHFDSIFYSVLVILPMYVSICNSVKKDSQFKPVPAGLFSHSDGGVWDPADAPAN